MLFCKENAEVSVKTWLLPANLVQQGTHRDESSSLVIFKGFTVGGSR